MAGPHRAGLRRDIVERQPADRPRVVVRDTEHPQDTLGDAVVVEESLRELAEAVAHPATADQDPAELVSSAIRRFVRLAYDDPTFVRRGLPQPR